MIRRGFAIILGAALLLATTGSTTVFAKDSVEEIRSKVSKLGVGEKARVEVRRLDGTKLKGFVSRAGDQSFAVTDEKTSATIEVAYADVAQLKKRGGLSGTTKALIWGGAAAGAAVVLFAVRGAFCDGMCV